MVIFSLQKIKVLNNESKTHWENVSLSSKRMAILGQTIKKPKQFILTFTQIARAAKMKKRTAVQKH